MAIGWHFFYEGVTKLLDPGWTAADFLSHTTGFASVFYHWLAASPERMMWIDGLNVYGLIGIGLALGLGVWSRWASLGGATLLALYYFAYPPWGISWTGESEGAVFVVNRLFLEGSMLVFLFFYPERGYGLEGVIRIYKERKKGKTADAFENTSENPHGEVGYNRREVLKNLVTLPVLGALGGGAWWNSRGSLTDGMTGATLQLRQADLSELKGTLPKGKLGSFEMSRLVMGGNLIGGWAHARDLLYAGSLFKAYNTEKKIVETLQLCERAGIDSINIGYPTLPMMAKYKKLTGSKMKVIVQVGIEEKKKDRYDQVMRAIDGGADILQLQGNWCDWLVRDHRLEVIAGMMDRIRKEGYIAGLASHTIDALLTCEAEGILPDYYMKTMHHDRYWSAHPRENRRAFEVDGMLSSDHNQFHDNCFCPFPDRTVEFVNRVKIPVMGFKVLAAGAIDPKDGFRWAFENGADFICVGMFDFQVVDDVNTCIDVLQTLSGRTRAWYA